MIGRYRTKLFRRRRLWTGLDHVGLATLKLVERFNHRWFHSAAPTIPPALFDHGSVRTPPPTPFQRGGTEPPLNRGRFNRPPSPSNPLASYRYRCIAVLYSIMPSERTNEPT